MGRRALEEVVDVALQLIVERRIQCVDGGQVDTAEDVFFESREQNAEAGFALVPGSVGVDRPADNPSKGVLQWLRRDGGVADQVFEISELHQAVGLRKLIDTLLLRLEIRASLVRPRVWVAGKRNVRVRRRLRVVVTAWLEGSLGMESSVVVHVPPSFTDADNPACACIITCR